MTLFILQGDAVGLISSLIPFMLIMIVFYMFFIRPQAKKQKDQSTFVDDLKKGDEVSLASGIIGKITKLEEHTAELQVDTKTFIRVLKASISKDMTDALVKGPVKRNK